MTHVQTAAAILSGCVLRMLKDHNDADPRDLVLFALADMSEVCNAMANNPPGEKIGDYTIIADENIAPPAWHVHARCIAGAVFYEAKAMIETLDWECARNMNRHQLGIYLSRFESDSTIECTHSEALVPFEEGEVLIDLITGNI